MKLVALFISFAMTVGIAAAQENEPDHNDGKKDVFSSSTFAGLKFRSIGPALTSGRVVDFAVNPRDRSQYFVAAASGGVWKTVNAGTTWEPVFDGEKSYSIGCITLDPNNSFVVWVGTGENNSQRSVSYGDGVYKSRDGGKSWDNVGLKNSEHIGKIVVDPRNSDAVYVAAQGPLWSPGGHRGLYKTTDGGKTWNAVLSISENTGVSDVVMDPRNPDVLFASSYQRRRHVWTLINGGPESAIYKSEDGGANWRKLKSGLPSADMGRIGLAIPPGNPDLVYATIEAADEKGGFFRSTDRGETWEKRSGYVSRSPQYYTEIVCDPKEVDRVYSMDVILQVTDDGGKSFRRLGEKSKHVDNHAMWIDPGNTNYYLVGCDGGVYESFDRGENWAFKSNLPITQFYRVAVDNAMPFYFVYGGTQDNFSLGGPSATKNASGITNADWFVTNGGDGFVSQIDPEDPAIVYAESQYGGLVRYDRKSGELMGIQPKEKQREAAYRWNWDSPLIISPHSHTRLYFGSQILFRSDDRGDAWKAISGDLTRQIDRNTLPVMGKVWSIDAVSKNASTSFYGNIVSISESPRQEGLLYVGTDDGLIQVSEDGGAHWRRIEKFTGVPETTYVSVLKASQHNAHRVYAAFDNHKNGDFHPYLLKSDDAGKSWSSIAGNLPEQGTVYALAEDHVKPNLVFAGTEFGVFFTVDGGSKWIQLTGGLPTVAVRDIATQKRESDLVLASFGRGFFILDDYSVLREASPSSLSEECRVFPIKTASIYIQARPYGGRGKGFQGETFFTADNPPFGATFTYYLKESLKTKRETRKEAEKEAAKKGKALSYPSFDELRNEDREEAPTVTLVVTDASGNVVRRIRGATSRGIHRATWDLRYADITPVTEGGSGDDPGVLAMPGSYAVSVVRRVDGIDEQIAAPVAFSAEVLDATSLPASDKAALLAFQKEVAGLQRAVLGTSRLIGSLKERIGAIKKALFATLAATGDLQAKVERADSIVDDLDILLRGNRTVSSRNEPAPHGIMARVNGIVDDQWASTSAPTQTQIDEYRIAGEEFTPVLEKIRVLVENDMKQLEAEMDRLGAPWTPGRIPVWKDR